jgi:hypothetical protein
LACCHVAVGTATAGEKELTWPFAGVPQIVIDRLTSLLAQFKSDGPSGFLFPDRRPIRCVSAGGDILDPYGYDITAAKLAVDRQIKHREVACATFDLEFGRDRPDMFGVAAALPPSVFPCSMALAELRSLDPAWSCSSTRLPQTTSMEPQAADRNQVSSQEKTNFAFGLAAGDWWRMPPQPTIMFDRMSGCADCAEKLGN